MFLRLAPPPTELPEPPQDGISWRGVEQSIIVCPEAAFVLRLLQPLGYLASHHVKRASLLLNLPLIPSTDQLFLVTIDMRQKSTPRNAHLGFTFLYLGSNAAAASKSCSATLSVSGKLPGGRCKLVYRPLSIYTHSCSSLEALASDSP